jgi:hypothetical protein
MPTTAANRYHVRHTGSATLTLLMRWTVAAGHPFSSRLRQIIPASPSRANTFTPNRTKVRRSSWPSDSLQNSNKSADLLEGEKRIAIADQVLPIFSILPSQEHWKVTNRCQRFRITSLSRSTLMPSHFMRLSVPHSDKPTSTRIRRSCRLHTLCFRSG